MRKHLFSRLNLKLTGFLVNEIRILPRENSYFIYPIKCINTVILFITKFINFNNGYIDNTITSDVKWSKNITNIPEQGEIYGYIP